MAAQRLIFVFAGTSMPPKLQDMGSIVAERTSMILQSTPIGAFSLIGSSWKDQDSVLCIFSGFYARFGRHFSLRELYARNRRHVCLGIFTPESGHIFP